MEEFNLEKICDSLENTKQYLSTLSLSDSERTLIFKKMCKCTSCKRWKYKQRKCKTCREDDYKIRPMEGKRRTVEEWNLFFYIHDYSNIDRLSKEVNISRRTLTKQLNQFLARHQEAEDTLETALKEVDLKSASKKECYKRGWLDCYDMLQDYYINKLRKYEGM